MQRKENTERAQRGVWKTDELYTDNNLDTGKHVGLMPKKLTEHFKQTNNWLRF
jgi:hypothetical protein